MSLYYVESASLLGIRTNTSPQLPESAGDQYFTSTLASNIRTALAGLVGRAWRYEIGGSDAALRELGNLINSNVLNGFGLALESGAFSSYYLQIVDLNGNPVGHIGTAFIMQGTSHWGTADAVAALRLAVRRGV